MVKPPRPEQPLFSQLDAIQVADRIVQLPDVSVYLFGDLTTVPTSRDTVPIASDIDLIIAAPTTTCLITKA